jgi:circadian clock protein KaiB
MPEDESRLQLQLYVAGMSAKSMEAIDNITKICEENFPGGFDLLIIDIYKKPEMAHEQQIIFSPSLIRLNPLPKKILIGNFTKKEKILMALSA